MKTVKDMATLENDVTGRWSMIQVYIDNREWNEAIHAYTMTVDEMTIVLRSIGQKIAEADAIEISGEERAKADPLYQMLTSAECAGCGERLVCLDCDGHIKTLREANDTIAYLRSRLVAIDRVLRPDDLA